MHRTPPIAKEFIAARRALAILAVVLVMAPSTSRAEINLGPNVTVVFASVAEGKETLSQRDDFVDRMSPFDRAARLKTDKEVSQRQYLDFAGKSVLEWSPTEKKSLISSVEGIQGKLRSMALPFPQRIVLIKTTGAEEGGAAYTRSNAIVLPQATLTESPTAMQKKFCHELFHILSRANDDLREELYSSIGFEKCDELDFPATLKQRKLTNPDAPRNDHCIRVKIGDADHWAIPILFSRTEKYDVNRGGEFFNYLQFQLLLVERSDNGNRVTPMVDGQKPRLVDVRQASGFFDQVGNNTRYILHPEEILADNFSLLVVGQGTPASPEVIERIDAILRDAKTP